MQVVRKETVDFYDTMVRWWEGHGFPIVDISILPKETFVYYINHIPIYSCCFYHTDSSLAWLAWQISNPSIPYHMKSGGMEILFETMEEYAKQNGYKLMFTTSSTPSVVTSLKEQGYVTGDKGVDQYLKKL